jgi:hypothetical protein
MVDHNPAQLSAIERLIVADPGRRGIEPLIQPGALGRSADLVLRSRRVMIATGFFIAYAGACETDGPSGALALGEALTRLDIRVNYLTDVRCWEVLHNGGLEPLECCTPDWHWTAPPDLLVSIERPGRAADGRYYNARGQDISEFTGPIDELFVNAQPQRISTIGIGDGGNEIGMGKVRDRVIQSVPNGPTIACVVPTDELIVAGVSNWGAWGLAAAVSNRVCQNLLPTPERAKLQLDRFVAAGAVDGVTGNREPAVDGLAWDVHRSMLVELHRLIGVE